MLETGVFPMKRVLHAEAIAPQLALVACWRRCFEPKSDFTAVFAEWMVQQSATARLLCQKNNTLLNGVFSKQHQVATRTLDTLVAGTRVLKK